MRARGLHHSEVLHGCGSPQRRTSAVPLKTKSISKQEVQSDCVLSLRDLWLCLTVLQKRLSVSRHLMAQVPVHVGSPGEDAGHKRTPGVLQTGREGATGGRWKPSHPMQGPFDQKFEQGIFTVGRLALLCFCWLFSSNLAKIKITLPNAIWMGQFLDQR